MSRWFRHYAGLCRDDKLVRVALKAKQPVERVVWVWAAILESAAEIDANGRYEIDEAEITYFLRADEADIRGIVLGLENGGRILEGCVAKWGDRQFQSDRSAERQKRYRERHGGGWRQPGDVVDGGSDGEMTSPSRHGDAPETETETELETEKIRDADASLPNETVGLSAASIEKKALREGLQAFGEAWNELAASLRMPSIDEIKSGSTRERHALARLREMDPGGARDLMSRIRGSPYLRGEVNGFRCTFDWIVNASNFQKIMEGNYEDRKITQLRR